MNLHQNLHKAAPSGRPGWCGLSIRILLLCRDAVYCRGLQARGASRAIVAIIATIIPPFAIITVISYFYELFRDNFIVSKLLSGMQAGVGAVIASVVWDMGGGILKQKSAVSDFIMFAAFLAACVFRVNVVYIILACIALGVLRTLLAKRRKGA